MTDTPSGTRPLALVTGASRGIGLELARQFAEHGYDLVVVAEDAAVDAAAAELARTGAQVRPVVADLATHDGVERAWAAVVAGGRPLDAAALNAGVGVGGPFLENDPADEQRMIDLNVPGTVHLARRVLTPMAAQGRGRVLVTSSIASTMPGPYMAVYNASKSFLQSLTEALQEELRDTGVTLTALMPGPTETDFFSRAGMGTTRVAQAPKDDPAQVARQGFEALMAGEAKVVAGSLTTKASGLANAVLPDSVKATMNRLIAEPGKASD